MDAARPPPADTLESVFLALRPELVRRARTIDPRGDADDVVQDVWLRVRAVHTPVDNARAYLMRMVYSVVLDRRRTLRRSAERDGRWASAGNPDGRDVADPEAERALLARERLADIDRHLQALGEPTNTIFRRFRIAGEPQRQIAADLGIALRTVEKHLTRAYAALHPLRADAEDDGARRRKDRP